MRLFGGFHQENVALGEGGGEGYATTLNASGFEAVPIPNSLVALFICFYSFFVTSVMFP